ncbi:MAG: alpha/beta fold hydrolase [Actinomycetia bacterium]|nr:alpha/beta fold hydrolase [Actinomycetes bacterium]
MVELELVRGRVDTDGEDIYWEMAQTGADDDRPVVVLSHGAGGTHAVWYQQVPVLGQYFRVVTWDSRGFGNSTNHNDLPSAEAAADDLTAVLDELRISQAHLVGQSMGGWHISAFAVGCPQRVLSMTYADTVGGLWTSELKDAFAEYQAQGGLFSGREAVGGHRALWSGTAERDCAHAFLYQALGSFHSPPVDKLADTIAWSVDHSQIGDLGVPVLFVAGTHDEIFPSRLLAASSQLVPNSRFVEIPAAGHSPYFEQPEAWNDAVLDFLGNSLRR